MTGSSEGKDNNGLMQPIIPALSIHRAQMQRRESHLNESKRY